MSERCHQPTILVFGPPVSCPTRRAFSLLEVLTVLGILTLLLAILVPALNSARGAAKSVVCASNMKSLTMEFRFFAEGTLAGGRGDSEALGENRFWINDFQDRLYRLDEFWDLKDASGGELEAAQELMLCPAGAARLVKRKGLPCGREAIGPLEDVSVAVNMRLYRAVFDVNGKRLLAPPASTNVTTRILDHPFVPLFIDVDGRAASSRGVEPFYIAPPLPARQDPYTTERYWSPSKRHGGKSMVGFVGGHVLSSESPELERWDWAYQADPLRGGS